MPIDDSRCRSVLARWFRAARAMLRLGKLLLLHQDGYELSQRGDLLVLHADDCEQFKDDEEEKHRNADEREGVVLDAQHVRGDPRHAFGPEGQADEGEADEEEQQGVAFLEPIRAQSSNGQQEEQATEGQEEEVLEEVHATSPFRWARGRGPDRAEDRPSLS